MVESGFISFLERRFLAYHIWARTYPGLGFGTSSNRGHIAKLQHLQPYCGRPIDDRRAGPDMFS
jgi:hypothetical protein